MWLALLLLCPTAFARSLSPLEHDPRARTAAADAVAAVVVADVVVVCIGRMQVKKQGLGALYTGIRANFLLCLNPAIKHAVFDQVLAAPSPPLPLSLSIVLSTCGNMRQ